MDRLTDSDLLEMIEDLTGLHEQDSFDWGFTACLMGLTELAEIRGLIPATSNTQSTDSTQKG